MLTWLIVFVAVLTVMVVLCFCNMCSLSRRPSDSSPVEADVTADRDRATPAVYR